MVPARIGPVTEPIAPKNVILPKIAPRFFRPKFSAIIKGAIVKCPPCENPYKHSRI